jgi:hypothetical protein
VELREEKEKSEKQASEKSFTAIFEHASCRIELRKEEMAGQGQYDLCGVVRNESTLWAV